MHAIKKLNADIRSSRQRMQAGQSPSAARSVPQTGETSQRKKPKAEHINTKQRQYIDSGCIRLKPR